MRFSTPCSRRNVRFITSDENVVAMIDIPAMPGIKTLRSLWLPLKIAPKRARNSSGSRKLKNAALGLRQNIRRSRRYWCQASARASDIGGLRRVARVALLRLGRELEVDVLQRRARDREVAQRLATRQRRAGQLVQQGGGVVGLPRLHRAGVARPPRHRVARRRGAELGGRAL